MHANILVIKRAYPRWYRIMTWESDTEERMKMAEQAKIPSAEIEIMKMRLQLLNIVKKGAKVGSRTTNILNTYLPR